MRWRVLARRVLGRKGAFLLRNVVSSLAFHFKFIPPANAVGREKTAYLQLHALITRKIGWKFLCCL